MKIMVIPVLLTSRLSPASEQTGLFFGILSSTVVRMNERLRKKSKGFHETLAMITNQTRRLLELFKPSDRI
ncbi:MAG: hypothetical protein WC071_09980 [Victivallaceae bacterium]